MNKREKSLFITIVVMLVIFAHFWGIKKYMANANKQQSQLSSLQAQVESYRNSSVIAEEIAGEVNWLAEHEPTPSTYGETQSKLVKFLSESGRANGFDPVKPKLIQLEDTGGKYRRAKVQITATAKEAEIYKWLVDIHQPTKFRAVTQIVMKPTPKDDETITCTLTAEQWLIDADNSISEEAGE